LTGGAHTLQQLNEALPGALGHGLEQRLAQHVVQTAATPDAQRDGIDQLDHEVRSAQDRDRDRRLQEHGVQPRARLVGRRGRAAGSLQTVGLKIHRHYSMRGAGPG
jgi:hypothetical protein